MSAVAFSSFAISQLTTSAGHAPELGDSLTPNVPQSEKGTAPQRRKASSPNAVTNLSPAQKTVRVLAYRGSTWNYGAPSNALADAAKMMRLVGRTNEARTQ